MPKESWNHTIRTVCLTTLILAGLLCEVSGQEDSSSSFSSSETRNVEPLPKNDPPENLLDYDDVFRDEVVQDGVESALDMQIGSLHVNPGLMLGTGFDDNVFFAESSGNRQSDFFFRTAPRIKFLLGQPDELEQLEDPNQLEFSYDYFRKDYLEYDVINAENHSMRLRSRLNFGRLQIRGTDSMNIQSDLITRGIGVGTTDLDFVPSEIQNSVEDRYNISNVYRALLDLSDRTGIYVEGSHRSYLFDDNSRFYDSNILKGLSGFEFALSDQTKLFGEIFYGQIANNPNNPNQVKGPHASFIGGFAGIRGNITTRIVGTVKIGYESRWFGDRSISGYDSPVANVGLQYNPLDRTFIFLNLDRALLLSNQTNNLGIIRDQIRLTLMQVLGSADKWRVSLGFTYQHEDFQSNPSRIFKTYLFTTGVEYRIQEWLSANLSYAYEAFDPGNAPVQSYDVNRVNMGVSIGY